MFVYKRILLLFFLFRIDYLFSQDLTGTWEGDLGNDEFLQVNIVQVNKNICGYTWDYIYDDSTSYCKANFTGYFDTNRNDWVLNGTSFNENSGEHILMRFRLKYKIINGKKILEGYETDPSISGSLFSLLNRQNVYLVKVSGKPRRMLPGMKDCSKKIQPKKSIPDKKPLEIKKPDTVKKPIVIKKTEIPTKRAVIKKPVNKAKVIVPEKPAMTERVDSLKKIKAPDLVVVKKTDNSSIVKQMSFRKNREMKRLVVNEKNIILNVYDNGVIDADTVSVFYNGNLVLSHQRLSEKPIVIPVTLDEKASIHEIILFAENLGSISPNTALIVVNAGDKRYELFSNADLGKKAGFCQWPLRPRNSRSYGHPRSAARAVSPKTKQHVEPVTRVRGINGALTQLPRQPHMHALPRRLTHRIGQLHATQPVDA